MKKNYYIPKKVQAVESLLWLFVKRCPTGLLCFFGEEKFPAADELFAMLSSPSSGTGEKVAGGAFVSEAERVVEAVEHIDSMLRAAGGLDLLRRICTEYAAHSPREARMLKDMAYIGRSFRFPTVEEFARKQNITVKQFYVFREQAISSIAWEAYRSQRD